MLSGNLLKFAIDKFVKTQYLHYHAARKFEKLINNTNIEFSLDSTRQ